MKSFFFVAAFILLTVDAIAASSIPPELAGTWHTKTPDSSGYLCLRADGVIVIGSSIGIAGIATYDSKSSVLTASLCDEHIEKAKATLIYNQDASTITFTKLICYYDMHGPSGRLSQSQEEYPKIVFTNHEKALPDFVRSLDIQAFSK